MSYPPRWWVTNASLLAFAVLASCGARSELLVAGSEGGRGESHAEPSEQVLAEGSCPVDLAVSADMVVFATLEPAGGGGCCAVPASVQTVSLQSGQVHTIAPMRQLYYSQQQNGLLGADGSTAYWFEASGSHWQLSVARSPAPSGRIEIVNSNLFGFMPTGMIVGDDGLYVAMDTGGPAGGIRRIDDHGVSHDVWPNFGGGFLNIALDERYVYARSLAGIVRVPRAGATSGGLVNLASQQSSGVWTEGRIVVADGQVYWGEGATGDGGVFTVSSDGGSATRLSNIPASDVAVGRDRIYALNRIGGAPFEIRAIPRTYNGAEGTVLAAGPQYSTTMVLYGDFLYWTECVNSSGHIRRMRVERN